MSTSRLDLGQVPIVDNHAHALTHAQPRDVDGFRQSFTEAHSPLLAREHVQWTVYYRWALRQLGKELGVEADEDAILHRRSATPPTDYARSLAGSAHLAWLLLDEGYPPLNEAFSSAEMESILGVRVGRILRIETLVQELILGHGDLGTVVEAFVRQVSGARAEGYVSLKSIAAYRTGLAIESVREDQVEAAFEPVRREAEEQGSVRLASKPLVDFFIWRAAGHAAAQRLPFQFHTGYGDPDLDLRLANPLHLRPLFEDPDLAEVPIVLLHESYPFTAEAAYLAAAYPNAYLDIAFSLPPLDRLELTRVVGSALAAAPASKILVSSDGTRIPEHYWLGAVRARAIVADVLDAMIEADELDRDTAEMLGRMILHDNAVRLYSLA